MTKINIKKISLVVVLGIIFVFLVSEFFAFEKDTIKKESVSVQKKLTPTQERFLPRETLISQGVSESTVSEHNIEIVAENLSIPWEVVFLPDGDLLVAERAGTIKRIGNKTETIVVKDAFEIEEGGLLGMALHPDFEITEWLYLYFTVVKENRLNNRLVRYRYTGNELIDEVILIDDIPGGADHSGGRIAFGPDGYLYITTGDALDEFEPQNIISLGGKILRVKDDGSIPEGNPFGNAVYSYGHRNPQGLAWDDKGRLWATEHGPSRDKSGFDELNLIESGGNYGWPNYKGDETGEGIKIPIIHSGPDDTWAPADALFLNGSIFFTGLRGQSLYQVKINDDGLPESMVAHFRKDFGRLRALTEGPDGYLYVTTSNTDERGVPHEGDDKIIKINPEVFQN